MKFMLPRVMVHSELSCSWNKECAPSIDSLTAFRILWLSYPNGMQWNETRSVWIELQLKQRACGFLWLTFLLFYPTGMQGNETRSKRAACISNCCRLSYWKWLTKSVDSLGISISISSRRMTNEHEQRTWLLHLVHKTLLHTLERLLQFLLPNYRRKWAITTTKVDVVNL